jgi:6-phosphofructokinase 1
MVGLHGTEIVRVPLGVATGTLKTVPISRYEEATSFFG